MTRIVGVEIGGPVEPWRQLGLGVLGDVAIVGTVAMRFVGGQPGIRNVLVDEARQTPLTAVDGAAWGVDDIDDAAGRSISEHPLGTSSRTDRRTRRNSNAQPDRSSGADDP